MRSWEGRWQESSELAVDQLTFTIVTFPTARLPTDLVVTGILPSTSGDFR